MTKTKKLRIEIVVYHLETGRSYTQGENPRKIKELKVVACGYKEKGERN